MRARPNCRERRRPVASGGAGHQVGSARSWAIAWRCSSAGAGTARNGRCSGLHSKLHSRADRQIMIKLGIDAAPESRTAQVVQILESDIEIQTLWYMANRTSRRAAVNDHGPVHVRTSMHHGDRLLRLLIDAGVQPNCITDHGMSEDDARWVVLLGGGLHAVGMSIHRDRHELLSVPIALDWLRRKLPPVYGEPQLTVIVSEVVHAVLAHNVHERCLTLEAGIVKVADALDMTN